MMFLPTLTAAVAWLFGYYVLCYFLKRMVIRTLALENNTGGRVVGPRQVREAGSNGNRFIR